MRFEEIPKNLLDSFRLVTIITVDPFSIINNYYKLFGFSLN